MESEQSLELSPVLAIDYPHIRMFISNDLIIATCNLLPLENSQPTLCPKIRKQLLDYISLKNPQEPHEVQDFYPKPESICVNCPICRNTDHRQAIINQKIAIKSQQEIKNGLSPDLTLKNPSLLIELNDTGVILQRNCKIKELLNPKGEPVTCDKIKCGFIIEQTKPKKWEVIQYSGGNPMILCKDCDTFVRCTLPTQS